MRNPHNDPLGSPKTEADDSSLRQAQDERGGGSERRCVLTGTKGSRDTLVRLALSPADDDGMCHVLPDPLAKAPGRGAWIGVQREELASSGRIGQIARGAVPRVQDRQVGDP